MNRPSSTTQLPDRRLASRTHCAATNSRCYSGQKLNRCFHRNQQYSISAITDGSAEVVERYAYTAYGTPTITDASGTTRTTTAVGNRYTYTGREWDETLALCHYRARMYDSVAGRSVSRDPIGYNGGLNCYACEMFLKDSDPYGKQVQSLPPVPVIPYVPPLFWPTPAVVVLPLDPAIVSLTNIVRAKCQNIRNAIGRGGPRSPYRPDIPLPSASVQVKCREQIDNIINTSKDPRIVNLLNVLNKPGGECRRPPVFCRCCGPMALGYFSPHGAHNRLQVCIDQSGRFNGNIIELIVHELTHAAQHCTNKNDERTCDASLKREMEAYFYGNSCGSFAQCLQMAIGSSCQGNCSYPSELSVSYVSQLQTWFDQNSSTFGQF